MRFEDTMENIGRVFEAVGVVVMVIGGLAALASSAKEFSHLDKFFLDVRRSFGRPLILGLEILVAADIIETITVDHSLERVIVLGVLVLVRIALSFSLDIEVEGMVPWHRAEVERKSRAAGIDPDTDK
jgi:uncharacterized membrane protein